ncbi:MAG: molybdopterin-dependent oxidoreductase [Alphaproteobacteria bacterium]|nr:molybdopterin-dependent oxidoreductase [Alphaproteobacteria bacterium]
MSPPTPSLSASEFVRQYRKDAALQADPDARARFEALTSRASVCSYCGVGCPYTVEPDGKGRDQVVPLSPLGLCVKGRTSLRTGGDDLRREALTRRGLRDDRIRAPMLRGHDGRMHEVTWEEALDRAAWLFLHAREWVGPDAVALYGNGQKTLEAIWMASLYKLVFRLPTIGANSEHCLASAGAAHELNFGNEASFTWREFDELERCDVAVLHGTNAFITFPQAYEKLKRNAHAVKVVIDPVRTDTVSDLQEADPRTLHLRFRQGGDVLFNLAVSRVILEEGWQDEGYLARAVDPESRAAFTELVMQDRCAPEAVAAAIALADQDPADLAAQLRAYAALIAKPGPDGERPRAAFVSSMGINQSTGSYGFSTNLNLLLLTGNVGRPGAGSLRIAGQSNATSELMMGLNSRRLVFNLDPANPEHRARLARALDLPEHNIPPHRGTAVAHMADDDRLYCFLFMGTQMTRNMPRLGHWMRRLGRSFNVVIDCFLGEGVTEWADVLLPALSYTERTGVIQRGDRSLQLQQGLTAPPPLAWSDEKILVHLALAIARRLRDPDTATLNDLDPDVVERTFARYVDADGEVDAAAVFDHMVAVSRQLDLYSRLEADDGRPISHRLLRERAGVGVQWQGDARYTGARQDGAVFPDLERAPARARLVRPPDAFMEGLVGQPPGTLNLISGRGRPGRLGRAYRGRYNSGIKTLPISAAPSDDYHVEMHPDVADAHGLTEGSPVRLVAEHGAAIGEVALNDRVPPGTVFVDFVPGEINRLTDYVDADRFTAQSFIKRTAVSLRPLEPLERRLWDAPDEAALHTVIERLYARFRAAYGEDEGWLSLQRGEDGAVRWLHPRVLRNPISQEEQRVTEAAGAATVFIQRFVGSAAYRATAAGHLQRLSPDLRHQLLTILLPLLRRFDYQSALHPLLSALCGSVRLVDADGEAVLVDLMSAHKAAVLEFKEEIVANQLYVAILKGLELLFGHRRDPEGRLIVHRDELAFVSGIAIPCAGDVPAHFLGISTADLDSDRLIHSRAIGSNALIMVDRTRSRAVRVDVHTGVLPLDRELTKLRGVVINKKRGATPHEHSRFFDRLGELVVDYIRLGDGNFHVFGPVHLDWAEYRDKLSIAPAARREFRQFLVTQKVSRGLGQSLVDLGVLDAEKDATFINRLATVHDRLSGPPKTGPDLSHLASLPLTERIDHVVETIIAPVLRNDGGRLDILDVDEAAGRVEIRFVGSCANCPYSLLSMEQLVKPSLLAIPGVEAVVHRAKMRRSELKTTA